ncbi:hypothetical protein [Streptosporangium sp. NPDC051022]
MDLVEMGARRVGDRRRHARLDRVMLDLPDRPCLRGHVELLGLRPP